MPPLARLAALLLAAAGCVLLLVAEFTVVREIKVITVVQETKTGGEFHLFALGLIAVAAAAMAYGGIVGGARPAQFALLALALAAVFVVFALDFPKLDKEGFFGEAFERAKASPKTGFYLESLGAILLLLSAVATLLLSSGSPETPKAPAGALDEADRE